jgi:hypothetical protein
LLVVAVEDLTLLDNRGLNLQIKTEVVLEVLEMDYQLQAHLSQDPVAVEHLVKKQTVLEELEEVLLEMEEMVQLTLEAVAEVILQEQQRDKVDLVLYN